MTKKNGMYKQFKKEISVTKGLEKNLEDQQHNDLDYFQDGNLILVST